MTIHIAYQNVTNFMEITNTDVNGAGFGATGCNFALRYRVYFSSFIPIDFV